MASKSDPMTASGIEIELRAEQASALKGVGRRLEGVLAQLKALDGRLLQDDERVRRRQLEERERLRLDALRLQWYLIVQREAMGLRHHGAVYEVYEVPARHP